MRIGSSVEHSLSSGLWVGIKNTHYFQKINVLPKTALKLCVVLRMLGNLQQFKRFCVFAMLSLAPGTQSVVGTQEVLMDEWGWGEK